MEQNQIQIQDLQICYDNFISKTPFDTDKDYGDEYANVYFRIDASWYRYPYTDYPGRKEKAEEFDNEVKQVFEAAGWGWVNPWGSGVCPRVKRGKENLRLHPQMFSGAVLKNHIAEIAKLLCGRTTFIYICTDIYETLYDMDDASYQSYLEKHRIPIRKRLVTAFVTKRRTEYRLRTDVVMDVARKFCVHRVGNDDELHGARTTAYRFVDSICDELIQAGWLISAAPAIEEESNLVRAVNKTEMRTKKLDAENLKLPGQLSAAN